MAINFLNNIASIGALTITRATTDPLLYLYNTTNGSGSTIRFSDQTTPSQVGDITYFHSDSSSQGGGASFHFRGEPDTVVVAGGPSNTGRFVSKSQNNTNEVDYGFYDDVDTGMYRAGANIVRLTAGGVQGLSVSSTVVSLAYNGSTKLATTSGGVTVTGEGIFTGNVGIGTTSPSVKLDIAGTDSNYIAKFTHSTVSGYAPGSILLEAGQSTSRGQGIYHYNNVADENWFTGVPYSVSSKKWIVANLYQQYQDVTTAQLQYALLTIDSDTGNVGIGTTSPLGKLQVNEYTVASQGNQNVHGEVSVFANNGDESLFLGLKDSAYPNRGWAFNPVANGVNSDLQIKEHGSSGVRMTMQSSGNVGIGTTSPDQLLHIRKTNAPAGIEIQGGLTTITAVGDVHSFINFGANDTSVTGGLAGRIESVSELTNGAHNGLAFYTGRQSRTPYLQQALFITSLGGISFGSGSTDYGTSGQVLQSNANASPTWVDARVTPATPSTITSTIVGETIEIAFNQSSTSNIDYYQVWSSDDGGDYGIIAQITPTDFSSTMTVVDTTFVTGGTMSYRVFAVREGIYSTAGTTSKAYTVSALSVTDMTVVNLNTAYYIQYEKPTSRFIDHVEIYMDSQTTSAALSRSNATIVYSGQNASYMRNVNTSSNFHQFWVEIVTS